MKRAALKLITTWHRSRHRRPLIIRGARQVGKSTLVRMFADAHDLDLFEVNLERHLELDALFSRLQVEPVLREIEDSVRRSFRQARNPLIFLDEIQATPHALHWLRYIYEEKPEIPVIAAGSLLEFALREKLIATPVGRLDYLWLYPMSFEEMLEARGEDHLLEVVRNFVIKDKKPAISETAHRHLMQCQREYLGIGGMPAAVSAYM